ncbi:DinB family protein [Pseudalkalibacillus hwajinpoensis]|uniref:DinB family protein n=1 Tax=Guptibacillus hwajinpoensis TaxID=208199 RepID=UPI001CFDD6CD|nr:DinB family protein [Pseudalkalibacillus hwajinpoensis]
MNFNLAEAIQILERTPRSLEELLTGLSNGWLTTNEGEGTWNAFEVIDHLIESERTNWMPRVETILEGEANPFPPFDRFAHLTSAANPIETKLAEFKEARSKSLTHLKQAVHSDAQLGLTGHHPAFGEVRLKELLATWVVHDFTHVSQITRVLAERYRKDVGPWEAYLGVLKR